MQIIIDLPEATVEKYRKMAELHHRDLADEIKEKLLEEAGGKEVDPALEIEKYFFEGDADLGERHDYYLYGKGA